MKKSGTFRKKTARFISVCMVLALILCSGIPAIAAETEELTEITDDVSMDAPVEGIIADPSLGTVPAPESESVTEPVPAPESESVTEPAPEFADGSVTEPVPAAVAESVTEPAPETVAETVTESVGEPQTGIPEEEMSNAEDAEEEEALLQAPILNPYLAVGGMSVTVTGTSIVDVFGDGKALYDPSTKTLTLKNADYTSGMHASGAAVVSIDIDLTIKGSGKLTGDGYGIRVFNGSLTLDGADLTAAATYSSGGDDVGIYADKNITIKNSTVKASGSDYGILSEEGSIYIEKNITSVTADGSQAAIASYGGTIHIDYNGLDLGIREPAGGKLSGDGKVIKDPNNNDATHACIVKYDLLPKVTGVKVNVTGIEKKDGKYYPKLSKKEAVYSDIKVPVSYGVSSLYSKQSCQTGDIVTTAPVPGTPYYFLFVIDAFKDGVDIPTVAWAENNVIKSGSSLTADKGKLELAEISHNPAGGGITFIFKYTETPKPTATPTPAPVKIPRVSYRTHVQNIGWQDYVSDGAMAGTTGQSLRLEGINIKLSNLPYSGGITYRTHVQNIGWQSYVSDGAMAGTSGKSLRLEGIQIKLTGELAKYYDVYYQTHVQNIGWTGWAMNDEMCGSAGYAYRLEGIRIQLVKKGSAAPGSTSGIFYLKPGSPSEPASRISGAMLGYNTHVQNYGWQNYVYDGAMAGTSGKSLRLEGIHIRLIDRPYSGDIVYRTHVQNIGWQGWRKNGEMSGTSGKSLRLEGIQIYLTGDMAKNYDIYYCVHAQDYGWLGWSKNGVMAGTSGLSKRLEGIKIQLVPKGGSAPAAVGSISKGYVCGNGTTLPDNPYKGN